MAWIAVAIGGAGLLGAGASIFGASKQADAATQASQLQAATANRALDLQQKESQPFIDAGSSVLPTLTKLLTPGADMSEVLKQIPGFQFAQKYGQKAITNQATSRGLSGNALTAGADYATGSANSAYTGIVQALLSQAGLGASAAGTFGGQAGQTLTNLGNAQASGVLGSANALSTGATGVANAVGGGVNSYANLSLLKSLLNKGGGTGIYSSPVDAGTASGVGSGGFNFLDAAA